jgi:hypothetical protein
MVISDTELNNPAKIGKKQKTVFGQKKDTMLHTF